jgi:hypothetical protein
MIEKVSDETIQQVIKAMTDQARPADHLRSYFFLVKVVRHPEVFAISNASKAAFLHAMDNLHDHELTTKGEILYQDWERDLKAGIASFRDEPQ